MRKSREFEYYKICKESLMANQRDRETVVMRVVIWGRIYNK